MRSPYPETIALPTFAGLLTVTLSISIAPTEVQQDSFDHCDDNRPLHGFRIEFWRSSCGEQSPAIAGCIPKMSQMTNNNPASTNSSDRLPLPTSLALSQQRLDADTT